MELPVVDIRERKPPWLKVRAPGGPNYLRLKRLMRDGIPCSGPGLAKCVSCAAEHYGPVAGTVTALSTAPTAGENVAGLWFVASAYNLFVETVATVTPQATPAAAAPGAPFFTNGGGRSVYFFKNDTRGVGATPAVNTCNTPTNTACNGAWTPWTQKP